LWLSKICLNEGLTPTYAQIKIKASGTAVENILEQIVKIRMKNNVRVGCYTPKEFHSIYWVICPVWSCGIQLWGCTIDSNIQVIQRYQNKVLKCIVNAPCYVRNSDRRRDLGIETVTDIITKFANSHEKRLQDHTRLLNVNNITRRLKRKKPSELVRH
jgi:uncharacterized protein YeeX (DUF496 family)